MSAQEAKFRLEKNILLLEFFYFSFIVAHLVQEFWEIYDNTFEIQYLKNIMSFDLKSGFSNQNNVIHATGPLSFHNNCLFNKSTQEYPIIIIKIMPIV